MKTNCIICAKEIENWDEAYPEKAMKKETPQREQANGIDLTPIPVGGRNGPRVGY